MTSSPRYRIVLVEEPETTLPVRYRRARVPPDSPARPDPIGALLEALFKLSFRSEGESAWAPVLSDNPLAFLLDAMGDAVLLWRAGGDMVYANPAARRLGIVRQRPAVPLELLLVEESRYERRCLAFRTLGGELVLEVLRRVEE
jgi:PAS domain-containing protein